MQQKLLSGTPSDFHLRDESTPALKGDFGSQAIRSASRLRPYRKSDWCLYHLPEATEFALERRPQITLGYAKLAVVQIISYKLQGAIIMFLSSTIFQPARSEAATDSLMIVWQTEPANCQASAIPAHERLSDESPVRCISIPHTRRSIANANTAIPNARRMRCGV